MTERVWDRFLSERDRAMQRPTASIGFGSSPALVMIDLYRWVFGDRPQPLEEARKDWPGSCGLAAWESLPHIQSLLSTAREAGVPVVHVTGLDDNESGMKGWATANRQRGGSKGASSPELLERQLHRFDIVDELAPIPGEVFLRKTAPSAFAGTPLSYHLAHLGIDTVIVAGESTSGCVRASVVDACTHRYRVAVVEECVFDRTEAAHAINLFDMNEKYADVVSLAEAEQYIRGWQGSE